MPRAKEFKLYVHKETGHLYHKPVQLAGVDYAPADYLYEITAEQGVRIEGGEPVASVIRAGVPEEVVVDLRAKQAPKPEPEVKSVGVEIGSEVELTDVQKIEAMNHWKQVSSFAKENGIDFPEEIRTVEERKEFLTKKLAE